MQGAVGTGMHGLPVLLRLGRVQTVQFVGTVASLCC